MSEEQNPLDKMAHDAGARGFTACTSRRAAIPFQQWAIAITFSHGPRQFLGGCSAPHIVEEGCDSESSCCDSRDRVPSRWRGALNTAVVGLNAWSGGYLARTQGKTTSSRDCIYREVLGRDERGPKRGNP